MLKMIYHFPQNQLLLVLPTVLVISFITGLYVDTTRLGPTILMATIIMIFATMVGLKIDQLTKIREESKLIGVSFLINFIWIPLVALVIGMTLLSDHPLMFAGLALVALLPTSGMTIAWTGIQKGNMPAAVKLTVFGLIAGSVMTPWYLLAMVGQYVPIHIMYTFRTIFIVVFVPLVLGQIVTRLILKKYSQQEFARIIKPNLAPLSIWGLLYVVFVSTSARAEILVENLDLILYAVTAILLFYGINYIFATIVAKRAFDREDGIALVNGTVLRNLSIAIGIAATAFSAEAAILVTIAFMFQYSSISFYAKYSSERWFKQPENVDIRLSQG